MRTAPARSPHLDALRGVAAGLVLVAHASRLALPAAERAIWSPGLALMGQAGVVLFFVLSGYLVGGMWVRRDRPAPRLRHYAIRRLLRIWPAYAIAYVATALLLTPADATHAWQWPVHLLLVHGLVPGEYVAVFPVGWTLAVEALFYLVAPLLPRRARDLGVLWAASAVFATGIAVVLPSGTDPSGWVGPLRFGLPAMLGLFCPGVLVAMRPAWLDALRRRPATAVVTGILLLTVGARLAYADTAWVHGLHYQALAIGFGVLLLLVVDRPMHTARGLAPAAALGVVSYGTYLWHNTVMLLLLDAGITTASWAAGVVLLAAITLPIAWLSWVLIERPALRLASRTRREPLHSGLPTPLSAPSALASGVGR